MATATPVDAAGLASQVTGMLGDFSVTNLVTILGAGLGLCVGLVLFWFAFRWIKGKVMGALKKGKL